MLKDEGEDKKNRDLGSIEFPMGLESDLKVFLAGSPDKTKKDGKFVELKKNGDKGFVESSVPIKSVDGKWLNEQREDNVDVSGPQYVKDDDAGRDEDVLTGKRKRTCYSGMLNWIKQVSKDPCNPDIGPLPDRNKWKNYGSDLPWKQILLLREAMLKKKNDDTSSQQSVWQKRQKMHPSMYADEYVSEKQRCSQRLQMAKDSSRKGGDHNLGLELSSSDSQGEELTDKQSDSTADSLALFGNRKKRIPVGSHFQADVPGFPEAVYESDAKWLGTQIWPLDKAEHLRSLIERDPIGKGRQESCGCQLPGSSECVRFHIREKRMKTKLELGSAFYKWKIDCMGEEIALSWKKEDEDKFENIVKSNRLSSEKYFWDELFKFFPNKGREALVSYYFNVFLLRRRILQNRNNTSDIDSDDDESEFGPIANKFGQKAANSPGSIFCSPKKSHLNGK